MGLGFRGLGFRGLGFRGWGLSGPPKGPAIESLWPVLGIETLHSTIYRYLGPFGLLDYVTLASASEARVRGQRRRYTGRNAQTGITVNVDGLAFAILPNGPNGL